MVIPEADLGQAVAVIRAGLERISVPPAVRGRLVG
jgi:hypothetical protein